MTHRLRWPLGLITAILAFAIALWPANADSSPLAAVVGSAVTAKTALPDPLPLRRVFVPPDRLEGLLAIDGREQFLKMPREEFESQVQKAAREQLTERFPPQIVEAKYRARLHNGRLVGTGQWNLKNPTGRAAAITLEPLGPAIRDAKWATGKPALIFRGTLNGRTAPSTYLWADDSAGGSVDFAWSLRGLDEPEEERFEFTFPPSPIAQFELIAPAERIPTITTGGGYLTGPFPADAPADRLWKFSLGGQTRVDLSIRRPTPQGGDSAVKMSRAARWTLSATDRVGTIDFTLDSSRGSPTERKFLLDPGLVVTDVSGPYVESWRAAATELVVRFREPPATQKTAFSVLSPLSPAPNGWLCPTIHLPGAIPGSDTIEIACAPEVKIESWQPGDFRTGAAMADHITKLVFTGTLLPPFGEDRTDRRMPTLRYHATDSEFHSEESLLWRVEPGRNVLTAALKLTVMQGPLASLSIQMLPGYSPTSITAIPDDPGLTWVAVTGAANTWMIEPSKAIAGGRSIEFRIEARGAVFPRAGNPADSTHETISLPFPRVRPLGALERQLTFSGNVGTGLNARFATSASETRNEGAAFTAVFRNRDAEGELLITAIPPRVGCVLETTMSSSEGNRIGIVAMFHGRVDQSVAGGVTLYVPGDSEPTISLNGIAANAKPASPPTGWNWLPIAGARSGWQAVGTAGLLGRPSGSYWFIPFPRPLSGEFHLGVEYSIPVIPTSAGSLTLPLATLGGCEVREFKASLDPVLAEKYQPPISASTSEAILVPRNGNAPMVIAKVSGWRLADVHLRNTVDAEGRIQCALHGRVIEAGGPILEIRHPSGFEQLEGVTVGTHEVPQPVGRQRDTVRIPIATGEKFEIRYRVPSNTRGFLAKVLDSPPPQIPGAESIESSWHTAGEYFFWPRLNAEVSSANPEESRWIVRADDLRATGYALATILLAFAWFRLFRPRRRSVDLICVLLALALGLVDWVDTEGWRLILRPAFLASLFVLAGNFLRAGWAGASIPSQATAAVCLLLATAQAQAPEPINVYFVPGENNAITAYVPKMLLAKLDALAKPPLPNAIFTNAEYAVNVSKELANFDATFQFTCLQDGEQVIELPLTGVRLERAKLDGAEAFLDGSKPDRFGVPVRTAGAHTLQLRFAVPIAVAGTDREVRFGTPDVPSCQVSFQASLIGRQPDVTSRRGGQTVGLTREGLKTTADHGGGKLIHLRWREDGTAEGAKPTVSVREAGIWDIAESESYCTSGFLYRIQGGTLSQLKFDCPEGLEPLRVEVKTTDARPLNIGVKSWNVGALTNGWLPITVKLQSPVDGRIAVVMTARSRKLLSLRPTLRFPRSADAPDVERDSFFAVRTNGATLDAMTSTGTVDLPVDTLNKDFASLPELNLEKAPQRVLRRTTNASTELKPQLSLPASATGGDIEIAYTLGRRIGAEGQLKASIKEGAVLEFDLPAAMKVYDVIGPAIAGWGRAGNRVQIWFKQGTAGEVEATFHGALNYDLLAPGGRPPDGGIDLPLPRWPATASLPGKPLTLRVREAEGWEATPASILGLKNIEALPPAPGRWTYLADAPPGQIPHAKFSITQAEVKLSPSVTNAQPVESKSVSPKPKEAAGDPANSPAAQSQPHNRNWFPWIAAAAWLLGIVAVARLPVRRWPERLCFLGLLGAAALGFASIGGILMLAVATFGFAARVRKIVS
jgi:hypothetical protein